MPPDLCDVLVELWDAGSVVWAGTLADWWLERGASLADVRDMMAAMRTGQEVAVGRMRLRATDWRSCGDDADDG